MTCHVTRAHVPSRGHTHHRTRGHGHHVPPSLRVPPCPHRVVEVLDGEFGEPLCHQLLLAAGRHLLEPGGHTPTCPGGTQASRGALGGVARGIQRTCGGHTLVSRGDPGIPGGGQGARGTTGLGGSHPGGDMGVRVRNLGGPRGTQRSWGGGIPGCLGGNTRACAPLQLLPVLQQSLQVGEAEGAVEAVPVRPRLPDVGILLEQVLGEGRTPRGDTVPFKAPSPILVPHSCSQFHTGAHLDLLLVDVVVLSILLVQHRQLQPL